MEDGNNRVVFTGDTLFIGGTIPWPSGDIIADAFC